MNTTYFILALLLAVTVYGTSGRTQRKTNMKQIMADYHIAVINEWKKVRSVCEAEANFNLASSLKENPLLMDLNPSRFFKALPSGFKTGTMKETYDSLMEKCDMKPATQEMVNATTPQCNLGKTTVACLMKVIKTKWKFTLLLLNTGLDSSKMIVGEQLIKVRHKNQYLYLKK